MSNNSTVKKAHPLRCCCPSCSKPMKYLGRLSLAEVLKLYHDRGVDPPSYILELAKLKRSSGQGC